MEGMCSSRCRTVFDLKLFHLEQGYTGINLTPCNLK